MRKQLTKQDADFQMFADYYKIYQDFYIPEERDGYWQELIKVADEFFKKYPSEYAKDLMVAYMDSRERLYRLKKA